MFLLHERFSLTRQNQVDVEVVSSALVNGLTVVHPLVLGGEAGDVQVGLATGHVEEDLASVACVHGISHVLVCDHTIRLAHGDLPDHKEQLIPSLVGAGQVDAGSPEHHLHLISVLWIK